MPTYDWLQLASDTRELAARKRARQDLESASIVVCGVLVIALLVAFVLFIVWLH